MRVLSVCLHFKHSRLVYAVSARGLVHCHTIKDGH